MSVKHHIEQEIKLTAPDSETLERLIDSELVRQAAIDPAAAYPPQRLAATYYDTADWILRDLRWSLRTRLEGERHVTTLKRKGSMENGFSSCEEIEQPTAAGFNSTACVPEGKIAAALHEILPAATPLHERVKVNMQRRMRELKIGATRLELVTDSGVISANGKDHELYEVELELLKGDMDEPAVKDFISQLCRVFMLRPSHASKHQIGLSHYPDQNA